MRGMSMNPVVRTAIFAGVIFLVSVLLFTVLRGGIDLTTLLIIAGVVLLATVVVTLVERARRTRR